MYLYCGFIIDSNIPLPELPYVDSGTPGFMFCLERSRPQSMEYSWSDSWRSPQGKKVLFYHKQSTFHILRIPGLADFYISMNLMEIICYPIPGIPKATIRHQLLDSVLPRAMAHQGKLMLHASAVQTEKGVLVILGNSGVGKSTLAGYFHQAGEPAISDDVVWMKDGPTDRVWVVPSYDGLRLWDDSLKVLFAEEQNILPMAHYSPKKRVLFDKHSTLHRIAGDSALAVIVLTPNPRNSASDILFEYLPHRDAFIRMMDETFQLDSKDLGMRTYRMETVAHMVIKVPIYRLAMPLNYEFLPMVREKILETIH
jgi:hypothetical protein